MAGGDSPADRYRSESAAGPTRTGPLPSARTRDSESVTVPHGDTVTVAVRPRRWQPEGQRPAAAPSRQARVMPAVPARPCRPHLDPWHPYIDVSTFDIDVSSIS